MEQLWLYASIFLLCYIWGFFGLPHNVSKLKLYLYPAFFGIAFCFAVVAMKAYSDYDVRYQSNYSTH